MFLISGSHLLFHAVARIVPSAVWVLTVVFGMRTGVTPRRIATGYSLVCHCPETRAPRRGLPRVLCTRYWHPNRNAIPYSSFRKEVIQPHLPIRLPCYDFTPVIRPAFDGSSLAVRSPASGISDSHGVTGGVYKTRERIHRGMLIRDY